jgi:hypothetical protein
MSTVATQQPDINSPELSQLIQQFKMPRPTVCQTVEWHPNGIRVEKERRRAGTMSTRVELGFVTRIGSRTIDVWMPQLRTLQEGVPHCDDPKVIYKKGYRDNGGWDFTEGTKFVIELAAKVALLERVVQEATGLTLTQAAEKYAQQDVDAAVKDEFEKAKADAAEAAKSNGDQEAVAE